MTIQPAFTSPFFAGMLYTTRPHFDRKAVAAMDRAYETLGKGSMTGTQDTQAAMANLTGNVSDPATNYYEYQGWSTQGSNPRKIKAAIGQLVDAGLPFAYVPHADMSTPALGTLKQSRFLLDA